MLLAGLATILLASIVLTNPFTEKLFYFDVSAGYVEGPWYRLMYYSALFHLAVILILVISWRKEFGPRKTKVILDILIPVSYTHLDVYKRQGEECDIKR